MCMWFLSLCSADPTCSFWNSVFLAANYNRHVAFLPLSTRFLFNPLFAVSIFVTQLFHCSSNSAAGRLLKKCRTSRINWILCTLNWRFPIFPFTLHMMRSSVENRIFMRSQANCSKVRALAHVASTWARGSRQA